MGQIFCKFLFERRSIERSVAVNGSNSTVTCVFFADEFGLLLHPAVKLNNRGGGQVSIAAASERTLLRSIAKEKTMRRSFLLTVIAAMAAFLSGCTDSSTPNKPATTTPAASPTATAPVTTAPSPPSTASPTSSPTKDDKKVEDKKPETKANPATSPTKPATPEKK